MKANIKEKLDLGIQNYCPWSKYFHIGSSQYSISKTSHYLLSYDSLIDFSNR